MQLISFSTVVLLALALVSGWSRADDAKSFKPLERTQKYQAMEAKKQRIAEQRKAAAAIEQIDINNAGADELKRLPGITDAEAAKLIAGRPYATKAWLVTKNIIDPAIYGNIKALIIAKQPYKEAARNAAIYEKKK